MCSLTGIDRGARRFILLGLLTLCLLLGGLLLAGWFFAPTPAMADDWDGDQVIRKDRDKKDAEGDSEDEQLTADERRQAYEEAADPEAAAAAKSKSKSKKGKGKSKGKSKSGKHNHDDMENDGASGGVDEYGSYFGLGDEEAGAQPGGGDLRYVEGQGYVRDGQRADADGTTSVLRERGGRDEADARQGDPDQAEAEQVWGPLWGVPADSPVMAGYSGPDHEMTPQEEESLRTGNKAGFDADGQPLMNGDPTEVVYGDEESMTPKERKALAKQRKAEEKARLREEREAEREAAREAARQEEYERLSGKDTGSSSDDEVADDEGDSKDDKPKGRNKQHDPDEW